MATDPGQPPAAAPLPSPSAPTVPEITSTPDERQMAMVAHLAGILPFMGFAVPLGLWAAKMGQSPFIEDQAKESLNLQVNMLMINVLGFLTCMVYVGYVLVPAIWIVNGIFCYTAAMAAKEGKVYRYPYTIRYIN